MLAKFIKDCKLLLPGGAADSARCMGLRIQHVSLNNAYHVRRATQEAF